SGGAAISADGRFVAFASTADNLVSNDTNDLADVFVHDRVTGTTERVSVDSSGMQAEGSFGFPAISADGRIVAFLGDAGSLVPGLGVEVLVRDRLTGTTEIASDGFGGLTINFFALSADGRFVAFEHAPELPGGPQVLVRDRLTGAIET